MHRGWGRSSRIPLDVEGQQAPQRPGIELPPVPPEQIPHGGGRGARAVRHGVLR